MSRKLKLDLDKLSVSSFATQAPAGERGTVRANAEESEYSWPTVHSCMTFDEECLPTG